MERCIVVDYGSGNLRSAEKACAAAAAQAGLDIAIEVSDAPEALLAADRVLLPGVGAFGDCMAGLAARPGLLDALHEAVQQRGRPMMGICVGMQLCAETGLEKGRHRGLGYIPGSVEPMGEADPDLKVPQIGWNRLELHRGDHPLVAGLPQPAYAYFVHSYAFRPQDAADVVATCDYGGAVPAVLARGNVVGTQFHPEKSQSLGLALLGNFLGWRP